MMNPGLHVFLATEQRRFESSVHSWQRQVQAQRTFEQALRLATHAPNPPSVIASLATAKQAKHRASMQVEDHLLSLAKTLDAPTARRLYRQACGHWPRVAHALNKIATAP